MKRATPKRLRRPGSLPTSRRSPLLSRSAENRFVHCVWGRVSPARSTSTPAPSYAAACVAHAPLIPVTLVSSRSCRFRLLLDPHLVLLQYLQRTFGRDCLARDFLISQPSCDRSDNEICETDDKEGQWPTQCQCDRGHD